MANDSAPPTRVFSLSIGEIRKYRPDHEILPHWSVVMVGSTRFSPVTSTSSVGIFSVTAFPSMIGRLLTVFALVHIVNKACIFSIVLHFVGHENGPRLSHFCEGKIYLIFLFFLGTTDVTFFWPE